MRRSICFLVAFASVAVPVWAQSASELSNQVVIRRTEFGVPHILADNEAAAGFAMGYVQAEDHAERIARLIIAARGELAATFGDVDGNLKSDLWNKQFRIFARAQETYDLLDEDLRAMIDGYALGFNTYVAQHRSELPEWMPEISNHDVAAHGLAGIARFAFNRGGIIEKFVANMERGEQPVVDGEDRGSNLWAFDGTRTESGSAILMGNPHQPWSEVATYYEAHVTIPGKYNLYGSTFVGRPVLTTGFNEHLGWTHTVNYPVLEEIYALKLTSRGESEYIYDGRNVPITKETAEIRVRGASSVERTFEYTPLGPVIHRDSTYVYVLKSAAYEEFRSYQQWYRMGQAKTFEDFHKALQSMAIPMFNIGYADSKGNIYYLWNGMVPQLPHAANSTSAVRANGRSDVWSSYVGLRDLPQLLNPKGGYIMNSNSAPYFTNLNEKLSRSEYPGYFPENYLSLRSQHSLQLVNNDQKFSLEDVIKLKFNEFALLPSRVKADLIWAVETDQTGKSASEERTGVSTILDVLNQVERIIRNEDDESAPVVKIGDADVAKALDLLRDWDGSLAADSRGSALFQEWWTKYRGELDTNDDRGELFLIDWTEANPIETPRGLKHPERAAQAFYDAMASMQERFGSFDVTWGEIHRFRRGDKDLAMGGGGHDLGAFRIILYEEDNDGKYVANSGDSFIFAVEFGKSPRAFTVLAYSQSSNPKSPHFNDQAEMFIEGRMKQAAFTETEIQNKLLREYSPGSSKSVTDELLDRIRR